MNKQAAEPLTKSLYRHLLYHCQLQLISATCKCHLGQATWFSIIPNISCMTCIRALKEYRPILSIPTKLEGQAESTLLNHLHSIHQVPIHTVTQAPRSLPPQLTICWDLRHSLLPGRWGKREGGGSHGKFGGIKPQRSDYHFCLCVN